MRFISWTFVLGSITLGAISAPQTTVSDPAARIAAARHALGGDAALSAIQSLTISANLTHHGPVTTMASIAVNWVSPDKFLRVSRRSVGGGGPLPPFEITDYDGFNGVDPIRDTVAPDAPFPVTLPGGPPPTTPAEIAAARAKMLGNQRRAFIQIMLPLLVSLPGEQGLTLAAGDPVSLPNGPGETIRITRADGAQWRLVLDATTHLPALLIWPAKPIVMVSTSSVGTVPGRSGQAPTMPPPAGLPTGDPTVGMADVEWRMTISDYKVSDGLNWPRQMTTTVDGKRWEDMRLTKFKINPKIDPRIFSPRGKSR